MNDTNTIHLDTKKIYSSLNDVWQFIKAHKDISTDTGELAKIKEIVVDKLKNADKGDYFTPALFDLAYAIMLDSVEDRNGKFILKGDGDAE